MAFTFDVLKENETLAMHDRQQIPVAKLSHLEQFYTDVSKVYDHQLINHTVPTISGDISQQQIDVDNDDDDGEENKDDEEEDKEEETPLMAIIDNLDKARYQLDEMCQVIDMLTINSHPNRLLYKLSRPLTYPTMNRRHFCGVAQQKSDQFTKTIDIFKNGIKSIRKSIEKGRNFSKNLSFLSKYWRLTTLEVLKYDNMIKDIIPQSNSSNNRMNVFIDYRLQRKRNILSGLLPLQCTEKSGNIQIRLNNPSEIVKYLKKSVRNTSDEQMDNGNNTNDDGEKEQSVVGFDDEDEDEEDEIFEISESENEEKDEDNVDVNDDEVLSDWWRICEFVYFSQINLLYLELFNVLRIEVSHWKPAYFNGISCKLELNAIHIHSPSLNDFAIQFHAPDFVSNDDEASNENAKDDSLRWNKFAIVGDAQNIDDSMSKEIEQTVLRMMFKKWRHQNNAPLFVNDTLSALKREETEYTLNLNARIGAFEKSARESDDMQNSERKIAVDELNEEKQSALDYDCTECEILEYVVTKVNHRRLANMMKKVLISFSQKNGAFGIKWNQLNAKSIVTVTVSKRGKLLLNLTLNGIKITVIKYKNKKSKLVPCSSAHQLQKILNSFT